MRARMSRSCSRVVASSSCLAVPSARAAVSRERRSANSLTAASATHGQRRAPAHGRGCKRAPRRWCRGSTRLPVLGIRRVLLVERRDVGVEVEGAVELDHLARGSVDVTPRQVAPSDQPRRVSALRLVEPEARFARALLDDEEPAGIARPRLVGRPWPRPPSGRSRRSRCRARPWPRRAACGPSCAAGVPPRRASASTSSALRFHVDRPRRSCPLPLRPVRVDHGGRVLLQQLAADHQHELVLLAAGRSRLSWSPSAEAATSGAARGCRAAARERVRRRPSSVRKPRDVPELAEVAAALVGRVLAPEQLARELVVEPDHVRLDEPLVGLEQRELFGAIRLMLGRNSSDEMSASGSYIGRSITGYAITSYELLARACRPATAGSRIAGPARGAARSRPGRSPSTVGRARARPGRAAPLGPAGRGTAPRRRTRSCLRSAGLEPCRVRAVGRAPLRP